jgi:hypothetical protein
VDDQQLLTVPFKDVAAALVRQAGLHEGKWALYFEFALGAANIPAANVADPTKPLLRPAAIIPVVKLGLRRVEQLDDLSVDAAEVNPAKTTPGSPRKRASAKAE